MVDHHLTTPGGPITLGSCDTLTRERRWVREAELEKCGFRHTTQRLCVQIALQSWKEAQDRDTTPTARVGLWRRPGQAAPYLGSTNACGAGGTVSLHGTARFHYPMVPATEMVQQSTSKVPLYWDPPLELRGQPSHIWRQDVNVWRAGT